MKVNKKSLLILWGAIILSCLIIFKDYIFGDRCFVFNDAASDTKQQYIMQYSSIIEHIRKGNFSLWDSTNGFGASFFALNPTNLFLVLLYAFGTVFGADKIPGILVYFEIIQIILAGSICYAYLSYFDVRRPVRVIASYSYAFSGYLLVWGQHYQFGCYVIFLPLILIFIEESLKKSKKAILLPAAVAVAVISSVYMSYMTLLFAGFYMLLRISYVDGFSPGERIKLFFKDCLCFITGICISMFSFLPNIIYMFGVNTRINHADRPLLYRLYANIKPYPDEYYPTFFSRLFSSNFQGFNDYEYNGYLNYYEAPVVFFGILFICLLFQYIFTLHRQKLPKRKLTVQVISFVLCCFILFLQTGSMIFNGFIIAFSRHTFVMLPVFALIEACALENILKRHCFSIPGALCAVASSIAVCAFIYTSRAMQPAGLPVWHIVIITLLFVVIMYLAYDKRFDISPGKIVVSLLVLAMINSVNEGAGCFWNRSTLSKSDDAYTNQLYGDGVTSAISYAQKIDPYAYRLDKDYEGASACTDAMAQGYSSISAYNSTQNSNIAEFVNAYLPDLKYLSESRYSFRQAFYEKDITSMLGLKYIISHADLTKFNYEKLRTFDEGLTLYRNNDAEQLGKFYTKCIKSTSVPYRPELLDTALLMSTCTAIDKDEIKDSGCTQIAQSAMNISSKYTMEKIPVNIQNIPFENKDSVSIPLNGLDLYERSKIQFQIETEDEGVYFMRFFEGYSDYFQSITVGSDNTITLTIPQGCQSVTVGKMTHEPVSGILKNIKLYGSKEPLTDDEEADISIKRTENDSHLIGHVTNAKDGVLMVTLPYEDGWHAYIDGKETKIIRANLGFIGIALKGGEHELELEYYAPGFNIGVIISAISLAFFALLCVKVKNTPLSPDK